MSDNRLNRSLFGLIIHQFAEFWYYYLGALVCLFATHWIQSFLPFYAKELADMVETGTKSIGLEKFFLLAVGIIVFRTSSRLLFFYPARVLQKLLRIEILAKLERCLPSRYPHLSDGQIFQVMYMDMDQLRALIGFALLQVGNIIVALIVLVPKIYNFSPDLIIAFLPMLISFLLFSVIVSYNRKVYKEAQDVQGEVQNIIIETYTGKKTIKNYHQEESIIDWFKEFSWKELSLFYRGGINVGVSIPLLPLGIGLSLLWGAHIIFVNDLGSSSLVLFSGFIFLFLEPMAFLSWIGVVFTRSHGSWVRIKDLLNTFKEPSSLEQRVLKMNPDANKTKELDVNLDFWGETLNPKVYPEQWNVIVGKTGVGKTYILDQMASLFSLREMEISYVSQSPYLYSDSIEANIFLGREATPELKDRAYDLLKTFSLDYLEKDQTSLLKMEVGEKGKRLSGGQAKRLALVRSLMSDAPILIWDDPFSSVDVIQERQIIQELKSRKLLKDKTVILTSHRYSTVKLSDALIFLDRQEGIVEEGKVKDTVIEGSLSYAYFEKQLV